MALLQASAFSSVSLPPLLVNGSPVAEPPHASDPVTITLQSGSVITVADSLVTLLKALRSMHLSNQWLLQLSPSVLMVSVAGTKALILERTLTNEKLIQSYGSPLYTFGSVRFASRTSYETKDLAGALAAMGALLPSSSLSDNTNLEQVHIQVADWNYEAGASAGQGSLLLDASPLVYAP